MHNAGMPHVTIRDVPEDVHAALLARAAEAGQSLQAYLQGLLAASVTRPTVQAFTRELLTQARERSSGGSARAAAFDAAILIREDRDGSGGVPR